ncbi:MAG: hydroxymethylglutaryl-CoA lyase [Rhizobiaceae bacterium]
MEKANLVYPSGQVTLREVGLRDGLQMVKTFPSTVGKKSWIDVEYAAGIRHFEVGSFLPKDRYPAFADVEEIIAHVGQLPGAHAAALTPNKKGSQLAMASGVPEIHCVISATEEHNLANLDRSRNQTLSEIAQVMALRKESGCDMIIGVGIAMSFGCSISGEVDPDGVLDLANQCFELGADVVSIADTVGFAGPKQVDHLTKKMRNLSDGKPFGVHLHDTRGMGIANAAAALDQGVRILDASMGGLGGCPFAPNATGNIVMEDLVFLCQSGGFETGVDVEKLIEVREILSSEMPDEPLHGALAKAGLPISANLHEQGVQ